MINFNKPKSGYQNYTNEQNPQARAKKLFILFGVIFVLIAIVSVALYVVPVINTENNEDEEPLVEWAGENSPLAGIQFLVTKNGLTFEQYSDFYHKLTDYFKEKHPDYYYVEYIEGTFDTKLDIDESEEATNCESQEEKYDEEDGFWSCNPYEFATKILVFKLQSDTGDNYSVEIKPDFENSKVNVKLFDANGEKLL